MLFFKKKSNKVAIDKNLRYFQTSSFGGIIVLVEQLLRSDIMRFESTAKNERLQYYVVNDKHDPNIGEFVVLIHNFGIVNNTKLVSKLNKDSYVMSFQFKDCRPYMIDTMGDDYRLDKLENENSLRFNFLM